REVASAGEAMATTRAPTAPAAMIRVSSLRSSRIADLLLLEGQGATLLPRRRRRQRRDEWRHRPLTGMAVARRLTVPSQPSATIRWRSGRNRLEAWRLRGPEDRAEGSTRIYRAWLQSRLPRSLRHVHRCRSGLERGR